MSLPQKTSPCRVVSDSGLLETGFKNSRQILELTRYGVKAVTVAPDVMDGLVRNAAIDTAIAQFTEDFQSLVGEGIFFTKPVTSIKI